MPFWTTDTDALAAPSTTTLRVEPAQVLQLKAELQTIYDEVEDFLNDKAPSMTLRPLGADPVSSDTAEALNTNVQAAADPAFGYMNAIRDVVDALGRIAEAYDLVEDTNAQSLRRVHQ